jgi:hypothetical protein
MSVLAACTPRSEVLQGELDDALFAAAFRCAVAMWAGEQGPEPVASYAELEARVRRWDGTPPTKEARRTATQEARSRADSRVAAMVAAADEREQKAHERQLAAVRSRLMRELARFRSPLGRSRAAGRRPRECRECLG